jgi:hypothetical protein
MKRSTGKEKYELDIFPMNGFPINNKICSNIFNIKTLQKLMIANLQKISYIHWPPWTQ